jgi:DNA-directed RNA polymerase specialized sigma24 family protein
LHKNTQDAIERLQRLSLSVGGRLNSSAARYDDALDRLLRDPERAGDPRELARQAERHARQLLARRSSIRPTALGVERLDGRLTMAELTHPVVSTWPTARWADQDHGALMVRDALDRLRLGDRDRFVIAMLADEYGIAEIADALGVSLPTARVIVHRTRRHVYPLYRKAV